MVGGILEDAKQAESLEGSWRNTPLHVVVMDSPPRLEEEEFVSHTTRAHATEALHAVLCIWINKIHCVDLLNIGINNM